jgi:hypothetical protein
MTGDAQSMTAPAAIPIARLRLMSLNAIGVLLLLTSAVPREVIVLQAIANYHSMTRSEEHCSGVRMTHAAAALV